MKETQSQDRHQFILGNLIGEENPTKLPIYIYIYMYVCINSTKKKPQTCAFSPCISLSLSLSYVQYTSEHVCPNEDHITSTYTLSST